MKFIACVKSCGDVCNFRKFVFVNLIPVIIFELNLKGSSRFASVQNFSDLRSRFHLENDQSFQI